MNIKQAKYLDMLVVVENYFMVDAPIAIPPPAFKKAIASLTDIISSIKRTIQLQEEVITDVGVKAGQKSSLVLLAATIADILYTWSSASLANSVRIQVKYSLNDLMRLKDAELIAICSNILVLANNNIKELEGLGLLGTQIQSLGAAIEEYMGSAPLFRNENDKQLTSSKELNRYFKQAEGLLEDFIDKMMLTFRFKDPTTYAKYASNRNMITSSIAMTQLKGKVISAENLRGLKDVLVILVGTNRHQTTSGFGVFSFRDIGIGKHSIALSTPGYQNLVINDLIVKQGKMHTQKITMLKK